MTLLCKKVSPWQARPGPILVGPLCFTIKVFPAGHALLIVSKLSKNSIYYYRDTIISQEGRRSLRNFFFWAFGHRQKSELLESTVPVGAPRQPPPEDPNAVQGGHPAHIAAGYGPARGGSLWAGLMRAVVGRGLVSCPPWGFRGNLPIRTKTSRRQKWRGEMLLRSRDRFVDVVSLHRRRAMSEVPLNGLGVIDREV